MKGQVLNLTGFILAVFLSGAKGAAFSTKLTQLGSLPSVDGVEKTVYFTSQAPVSKLFFQKDYLYCKNINKNFQSI